MSELSAQTQPWGIHGGHHRGILGRDPGGLSLMVTLPNLTVVPAISYEYLFYFLSSEWL
jgi:hypothetical protein